MATFWPLKYLFRGVMAQQSGVKAVLRQVGQGLLGGKLIGVVSYCSTGRLLDVGTVTTTQTTTAVTTGFPTSLAVVLNLLGACVMLLRSLSSSFSLL